MSQLHSTDLSRALFEEAGDALLLIDPTAHRVLDANPTAERLTGFRRAELRGRSLFLQDNAAGAAKEFAAAQALGDQSPDLQLMHARAIYKQGNEVRAARESMAEFDNVMFLDARPDQIPWREAFFTKIIVPPHLESLMPYASAELYRVFAPGGQIVRSTANA